MLHRARTKTYKELLVLLLIFGVLAILPIFISGNLALMGILIMVMIWAIVAGHWDLIMGHAGVFTFGIVALFVIGAFASGILTMNFGLSPWFGLMAGSAITAGIGVLISLPCLRLKGVYIALLTFALHMMLAPFLRGGAGLALGSGGARGLLGIPPLYIGGYIFTHLNLVPWFYVTLGISLASFLVIYKIIQSPWGLAFIAIRDSEPLAKSVGIDDYRYKVIVFGVTSFFSGLAGALYAHFIGFVSTRILGLDLFLLFLMMQVVGGMGKFPGALLGAIIVTLANHELRALGEYRLVALGAATVLVILLMPGGIMGVILPAGEIGPLERFRRFVRCSFGRRLSEEK